MNKLIYKTYRSMIELERENPHFSKTQIVRAIKTNKVYKGFRWNFKGDVLNPTTETRESNNVNVVLELNYDKTTITNSYPTKKELAKVLNIDANTVKRMIEKHRPFGSKYYILYKDCSQELLDGYKDPINHYSIYNSTKVKQINPISKQSIIYNSLSEVTKKCGVSISTLKKVIKEKSIYNGSIWEYIPKQENTISNS